MAKLSNTEWFEKWKSFYTEAINEDAEELRKLAQSLTESKTPQEMTDDEIDSLIDKEFAKFEKILKRQVSDFKKKVKKFHED